VPEVELAEQTLECLIRVGLEWAAAAAWRDIVDGAPRLAEVVYSWERPVQQSGVGLGF